MPYPEFATGRSWSLFLYSWNLIERNVRLLARPILSVDGTVDYASLESALVEEFVVEGIHTAAAEESFSGAFAEHSLCGAG